MRIPAFLGWLAAGLFVCIGPRAGGATIPEAQEPPIELPKFEVVDSRVLPQPESWRYAEIPGFEILSNISTRETKRFTQDFVLLQEVIETIMPVLLQGRSDVPTALILTGRGKGFSEFLPTEQRDEEYSSNGLFFENEERTAIVIDFALQELQLQDSTRLEADPYRSFYAEYFRFLIRRRTAHRTPEWLEEGLVQLFAGIDFNRKWINFGMIGDGFGGSKVGDFNELLARRYLMPLGDMFTHAKTTETYLWKTQCYAFVHMCLYGFNRKYQKPMLQFIDRLGREPLSEKLFKECFHASYSQMGTELRGYVEWTLHTYVQFKGKKGQQLPDPPPVPVRDATQAEVGRIKGEVLRLGGHDEAAHLAMIAPYIRGEKEPRLLAALGLDELNAGHDDRARKFLEAAMQQKVVRARAYLELGRLRYKEVAANLGPNDKLSPAQIQHVFAPLMLAIQQPPPLAGVYELMTTALLHATSTDRGQLAMLLEGVKHFPLDANLLANVTVLTARAGLKQDALALAERGKKIFARDPAQLDRFVVLSDSIARDAKPAEAQKVIVQPSLP